MASVVEPTGGAVESKGLKSGALGLASSTVIGVASTAPGYSIAASLGLVTVDVGFKAPAVMWISFIPMACIAAAFFYLNRADPDCGTNFAWVTRAMGPRTGWLGGWSIDDRRPHHHAEPRVHRRAVHVPALRARQPRGQHVVHARPRHRLHHGDDVDLRRRHRAQRPDRRWSCSSPSSPCSCSSASVALLKAYAGTIHGLGDAVVVVAHADELRRRERAHRGAAGRGVHLLGLGHRDERQRGEREREHARRASPACSPRSSSC